MQNSSLFIKGKVLNKKFKTPTNHNQNPYYIYQFLVKNNDSLFSLINIMSSKDLIVDLNEDVDLPVSVTLFEGRIIYEFIKD